MRGSLTFSLGKGAASTTSHGHQLHNQERVLHSNLDVGHLCLCLLPNSVIFHVTLGISVMPASENRRRHLRLADGCLDLVGQGEAAECASAHVIVRGHVRVLPSGRGGSRAWTGSRAGSCSRSGGRSGSPLPQGHDQEVPHAHEVDLA